MSKPWISSTAVDAMFGSPLLHCRIELQALRNPRLLWISWAAAQEDPAFAECNFDRAAYADQLVARCAFVSPVDASAALFKRQWVTGQADRYGGNGIGHNGGAGRACLVNGYYVKGVGRTLLVSSRTDFAHATGGAYLEEAIREAIFSEIVAAEFPHSGLRTLAIIDTGIVQHWPPGSEPAYERRVLIVREPVIRPAHFHRAVGFISEVRHGGHADHMRVEHMFRASAAKASVQDLIARYTQFWTRWGEQLAYGFIHRLPHGSHTLSNIAFDGRLLDFGAASSVPDWCNVATMLAWHPYPAQLEQLKHLLSKHHYYWQRFVPHADLPSANELIKVLEESYRHRLIIEAARVCGIDCPSGSERDAFSSVLHNMFSKHAKHKIDLLQPYRGEWASSPVWQEACRMFGLRQSTPGTLLGAPRPELDREALRRKLHAWLARYPLSTCPARADITKLILDTVAANRRDTRLPWPKNSVLQDFKIENEEVQPLMRSTRALQDASADQQAEPVFD